MEVIVKKRHLLALLVFCCAHKALFASNDAQVFFNTLSELNDQKNAALNELAKLETRLSNAPDNEELVKIVAESKKRLANRLFKIEQQKTAQVSNFNFSSFAELWQEKANEKQAELAAHKNRRIYASDDTQIPRIQKDIDDAQLSFDLATYQNKLAQQYQEQMALHQQDLDGVGLVSPDAPATVVAFKQTISDAINFWYDYIKLEQLEAFSYVSRIFFSSEDETIEAAKNLVQEPEPKLLNVEMAQDHIFLLKQLNAAFDSNPAFLESHPEFRMFAGLNVIEVGELKDLFTQNGQDIRLLNNLYPQFLSVKELSNMEKETNDDSPLF